ncbi:1,2-epoxyphenylacetyl-CoA isomerase [compost metagenome]
MSYQSITYAREGEVAVITLNQPNSLNALSEAMLLEVLDALAEVRRDKAVRALLLTASGRLFSAGANLTALTQKKDLGLSRGENVARMMRSVFNKVTAELRELPVPVVVALNGGVVGGAVGIALAGDVIVASRSAYFYLPFVTKLGLIPDLGGTWFLQRMLGSARALALSLTGERWSAEQAEHWGMVHACVGDEQLPETAMNLALQLSRLPAHGVVEARRAFDAASRNDLAGQLAYEADRQGELLDLPTFEEGVQAFFDKREPEFAGRD